MTIFDEPFSASLCTLDSSLFDDFDFDLELDDFEADVDLDVEEVVFVDLVVRGSDIFAVVVVVNYCQLLVRWTGCGLLMARLLTRQLRPRLLTAPSTTQRLRVQCNKVQTVRGDMQST